MSGVAARWIVAASLAALVAPATPAPAAPPWRVGAALDPAVARIGERVVYRGRVLFPAGTPPPRWLAPEANPDLTWGEPAPQLERGGGRSGTIYDTLRVALPLQAFRTGRIAIPGLRFRDASGTVRRLPGAPLVVSSVLGAADSNADLRPARGPLAAPWWERVPWRWVAAAIAVAVAAILAVRAWRRRRRGAPAPPVETGDAANRALVALDALRARRLPEQGRFTEHALEITRILRRYLEATTEAPRPGHTTSELVAALSRADLAADDLHLLEALLRAWDRIKFARAPSSPEECVRAEDTVTALVRARGVPGASQERAA